MTTFKPCRGCESKKPVEDFHKNLNLCKSCVNAKQREKHKNNPRIKKNFHLKYKYGITLDQYESMLEEQGNCCAICKTDKPGGNGKYFYVDHNHTTNAIRQLLCHHCNFLIGYAKEDKSILLAAIQYLENWSTSSQRW
jgi:membrane-bound lytic murein transglycosylase MltF